MRDAFAQLIEANKLDVPPVLRRFHAEPPALSQGEVTVEGGRRWGRLLAALAGFPPPMSRSRFRLEVAREGKGHVWRRSFARHKTSSFLQYDARSGRVVERFGPVELELSATARDGALIITIERARLFGFALPSSLCPQSTAMEYETPQGNLGFDISASLPRIGLLVRYHGYLTLPELDLRR
ncbi:DUF4166 domain-containing protein [Leisingera sp.]|uniref:DUF4166 domain-containing protein n=1 Tax=Leisingera sp. TaxID=1879318 RepID=UPI003A950486